MSLAPQFAGRFANSPDTARLCQPCAPAVLTEEQRSICDTINRYWNHNLRPGTDYGKPWKICQPDDVAVCHDYAVTKLANLVKLGLPRGALALATCQLPDDGYHMVLLAKFADAIYVLDNRDMEMRTVGYDDTYRWMAQEEWGSPVNWVVTSTQDSIK